MLPGGVAAVTMRSIVIGLGYAFYSWYRECSGAFSYDQCCGYSDWLVELHVCWSSSWDGWYVAPSFV